MGANAVRIYNWDADAHATAADVDFLDACAAHGVHVILGVSNYYLDHLHHVPTIVRTVARHPALLMWAVSNEAAHASADVAATNRQVSALVRAVREAERALGTWHPITVPVTCDLGHLDALRAADGLLEAIDVLGYNCYWDRRVAYPSDFFERVAAAWAKPLLMTEWGMDTYDNAAGAAFEPFVATWLADEWRALISPMGSGGVAMGGVLFEWMDEPWKAAYASTLGGRCTPDRGGAHAGWGPNAFPDRCANEAFFGLVELRADESLRLKPAYDALRALWTAPSLPAPPPASPSKDDGRPYDVGLQSIGIILSVLGLFGVAFVSLWLISVWLRRQSRERGQGAPHAPAPHTGVPPAPAHASKSPPSALTRGRERGGGPRRVFFPTRGSGPHDEVAINVSSVSVAASPAS